MFYDDWQVSELLNRLEHTVTGSVRDSIHTLQEGWDFVCATLPDPDILRSQGHNLDELHDQGRRLMAQYEESLIHLQQNWSGHMADMYLPPSVTAFQVEHGLEPTDAGAGSQLYNNLRTVVEAFSHNRDTHYDWGNRFHEMRDKQSDARWTIGGMAALGLVETSFGVGEVTDGPELAATAVRIGGILIDVERLLEMARLIGGISVAVLTAYAIYEAATGELALPFITTDNRPPAISTDPGTGSGIGGWPTWNPDNPPPYAKIVIALILSGISAEILRIAVSKWTEAQRDAFVLAAVDKWGCDRDSIQAFLDANPNLQGQDILKALSARQLVWQNQAFIDALQAKLADPQYQDPAVQKSIRKMMGELQDRIGQLNGYENQILAGRTPETIDNDLTSAQNDFNGSWPEWKIAEYYAEQGKLISFNWTYGDSSEIDVLIRDGDGIRFIQAKNYANSFGVNGPGGVGNSDRFEKVAAQIENTKDLANDPNVIKELQRQYPWFDGKITVEEDLINNQQKTSTNWTNVQNQLISQFGIDVKTTDPRNPPNDPTNPNYPFNDSRFYNSLTKPPGLPTDWCRPASSPPTPVPVPTSTSGSGQPPSGPGSTAPPTPTPAP